MTDGLPFASSKIGLVLGLPFGRLVVPREWAVAMSTMSWPLGFNTMYVCVCDKTEAEAREQICERALEANSPFVWMVDDDTVPPRHAIRNLIYVLEQNPDVAACGGIYCEKADPTVPLVFKEFGGGASWDWNVGEVFDVKGIGAGCLLLRTSVLKDIPKPWFSSEQFTADIYFCKKLVEAGHRIQAHGGILCDHYDLATGKVYRLPENSRPYAQSL